MWDPKVHNSPELYDGYRYYKMRHSGIPRADATSQLVSASPDHIAFGLGKPICPGRFMVANEIKIAIATILLKYDVRLADGSTPLIVHYGFEMLSDPSTRLTVWRRRD